MAHAYLSKDNLEKLGLSIHPVGSGDETQIIRLGACPTSLSSYRAPQSSTHSPGHVFYGSSWPHRLSDSPQPCPDLPASSLKCSPLLLLPFVSPLSSPLSFLSRPYSCHLLTDCRRNSPAPEPQPFPWIWAQYKQPRTPHLHPGLGSRVGWADEVISTGPPAGQQACEGRKCLFALVSLATCWTLPPLPSLSRPAKLPIGPLPLSSPYLAVLRPQATALGCQEEAVNLNPTSRGGVWKMEARPSLSGAESA